MTELPEGWVVYVGTALPEYEVPVIGNQQRPAEPSDKTRWFFEPTDYEGDVVYSLGYDTRDDAVHACREWIEVQAFENKEDEQFAERPQTPNEQIFVRFRQRNVKQAGDE
jgi:hypothetical protein